MSDDWLAELARARDAGEPCVLVTLAAAEGSAPREAGAKMLVRRAATHGSIGGGHLEFKAMALARAMIDEGAAGTRLETFNLGPQLGQCCGGKVAALFEPFPAPDFVVAIFGAGHVGKAVAAALADTSAQVRLIDGRAEFLAAAPATNVTAIHADPIDDEVADLPAGVYALVMTHSHDLDLALCERLLRRGDCTYVGLIGSATKRARFVARLRHRGIDEATIAALRCPIGAAGIESKHPREIAIAVSAELLAVRCASRATAAQREAAQ